MRIVRTSELTGSAGVAMALASEVFRAGYASIFMVIQ